MSADSKALPEFVTDCGQSWLVVNDDRMATESDLSGVLAAMDPERRANFLLVALHDHGDPLIRTASDLVQKAESELAAERAKVAELTAQRGNAGPGDSRALELIVAKLREFHPTEDDQCPLVCMTPDEVGAEMALFANELLVAIQKAETGQADERVAALESSARALAEHLGFPVPPRHAPLEWLDDQVRSLKRSADWETQEHARHHRVEEELRATLAKVEAERDAWKESAAMACERAADDCTCAGCRYAAEVHAPKGTAEP